MNDITEEALLGDHWVPAEGFIIIWKQVHGTSPIARHYIYGRHPDNAAADPHGKPAGWNTSQWARVYTTYADACAVVPELLKNAAGVADSDIRIVKVKRRQPVLVLDDLPYNVLQRLAEI